MSEERSIVNSNDFELTPNLIFNFLDIDLFTNLGVAKHASALIDVLSSDYRIVIMVDNPELALESEIGQKLKCQSNMLVTLYEAKRLIENQPGGYLEILIHHFKRSALGIKTVLLCHDLHVFDVPWKYKDIKAVQNSFRKSVGNADAVVCEFPRTYYKVEQKLGRPLRNLFLVPSLSLMEKKEHTDAEVVKIASAFGMIRKNNESHILFPSQFQKHKGHEQLIQSLTDKLLADKKIVLVFTGSDYDKDYTAHLKRLAINSGCQTRVCFLGRVTDFELSAIYQFCDAVVVPSMAEGGAYVPLEAISHRKAVAVNRIEATEMHLKAYGAQVLWFSVDDQSSIVQALCSLADSSIRKKIRDQNESVVNLLNRDLASQDSRNYWSRIINFMLAQQSKPVMAVTSSYRVAYYG